MDQRQIQYATKRRSFPKDKVWLPEGAIVTHTHETGDNVVVTWLYPTGKESRFAS